jgi:integrase
MASVSQHRNRWRVRWRDEHGRQLVESFATKAEAEKAAKVIEARAVVDGRPPAVFDENALTLAKWWDRWEPGRAWRPSSRAAAQTDWRKWIRPVFGKMPLEAITTADIERFHRKLESRGLAPNTIAGVHRTLSMCLQGAVRDQLIARNPAREVRVRRPPVTPPVALDAATLDRLFAAVEATTPRLVLFARLLAATGLRRSEAAGLTWDRVDLEGGELLVDRQLDCSTRATGAWCPTKTGRARRVVLPPRMVEELRAHRAAEQVVALHGLVFTTPLGGPWPRTTLQTAWHRAAAKLAKDGTPLPEGARGWHTLRHTTASRLLEVGVPPVEAAELLGHSPEMLLATYSHVVDRSAADERLRAALDR